MFSEPFFADPDSPEVEAERERLRQEEYEERARSAAARVREMDRRDKMTKQDYEDEDYDPTCDLNTESTEEERDLVCVVDVMLRVTAFPHHTPVSSY